METNGRKFVEYPPQGGYTALIRTLSPNIELAAKCLACGALREVPRDKLRAVSDQSVHEVSPMLRCQSCDRKHAKLITGYFVAGR